MAQIKIGKPQCAYKARGSWYVARERDLGNNTFLVSFVILNEKQRPSEGFIKQRVFLDGTNTGADSKKFSIKRDRFVIIPPEGANLHGLPVGYKPF